MILYERVSELAKKHHIGLKELATKLGLSESVIYQWKKSSPKAETLEKVATYFNVSTDYLLGRTDNPNLENSKPVSDDLDKILDNIKSFGGKEMTDRDRETIRAYLEGKFSDR
ncbi:helix-turn-helix domain-containing protein [Enterococcus gallinarum]|uniref:Helix-turn-helix transcriptional regulator n=1 Tax=Enterococcus gallinarum TaxID=1353 RepID=A0ABD4ZYE1_ENTGA|nr:helix-turn-helix transcriptional regulator [Enterococcus gallinarum]MBX8978967.1 helix-turn-helix transcriptional regulator [Enterococcus gallinarum]MDL4876145.1 helix-turn-helix transcriptional regulator [Enterococcus gallinarum]MDL4921723.1 helix-turn-helix transcriptional regulator [Enterococcus gallinarum]MDL4937631.1 helix-turn-helix transcriptional regulator [Enterococcus gallinarum]MDL4983429.1 helix-turn-helix transcriptional regulator [Enterococcus gallinarum]